MRDLTLKEIIERIKPVDRQWIEKAKQHTARLVMPTRALGRLHEISERLCGIQKTLKPSINRKAILIMAADHGVVEEGVSAYPQEVTGSMIRTFLKGGAGINAISNHVGAEVWVVDMGIIPILDPASMDEGDRLFIEKVARGTANMAKGPAMTRQQAEESIIKGFKHADALFQKGIEILGTGDMGIGNTTPSTAIGAVITGKSVDEMVGRGTGLDDAGLLRKKDVIRRGIQVNQPKRNDGLDVLTKVGGFEIGGIAGSILAGAYHCRPVVIDGLISTGGALVADALCPAVKDYIFAGHCSQEPGHGTMLKYLRLDPILDLGMRLGEGTGGALAMGIIEGALRAFCEVFTFEEAGVAGKN
ncbi:MAG TPA: nicotinate-nucleotide--dimethylbenzimidazole phosphoribosyltransferase [Desulfobacterales bacterium]|nr:nicotinate-nucleotide--dimethylbenzimidazole phosphoribosyltransferase [Desulfobacterales bacterium]